MAASMPRRPLVATQHDGEVLQYPLASGAELLLPGTEADGVADATIEALSWNVIYRS